MISDDYHLFRADPHSRWQRIADALERNPEAWAWALSNIEHWLARTLLLSVPKVIAWALSNIERWLAQRALHPAPLLAWRCMLGEAMRDDAGRRAFLTALRTPVVDAEQDQLRSGSPFVGGPFRSGTAAPLFA